MIGDLPPVWIHFSYKRLPDYCYGCGIIGYNHKECKVGRVKQENSQTTNSFTEHDYVWDI